LNRTNDPLSATFGGDGVTANYAAGHVWPNQFQDFPVLSDATLTSTSTTVSGTLNSLAPGSVYTLDFYTGATLAQAGQSYLSSATVTADSSGQASFSVSLPAIAANQYLTASATDAAGSTSEFAPARPISSGAPTTTSTLAN